MQISFALELNWSKQVKLHFDITLYYLMDPDRISVDTNFNNFN